MRAARHRILLAVFCTVLIAATGAGLWWWFHPEPGRLRLTEANFDDIPGWSNAEFGPALIAFRRSCSAVMGKPDDAAMGSYAGTVADWRAVCAAADSAPPAEVRRFFERWFTPVIIRAGRVEQGRFTGYYEPEIKGSRTRHGVYQVPVHGNPDDLISVDLGAFRSDLAGQRLFGRLDGKRLVPYASRQEVVEGGYHRAPVLLYTDDAIALFILHIQGSGRVVFEDGSKARIAYAGQNGHPYTAIGKILIERGVPKNGMSMQVIRAWLKSHPNDADTVMNANRSYVFFSQQPLGDADLGANGAQGVPLTPKASLAVDRREHALGTPFFVAGPYPLGRLMVAQDVGGAIRGVIRGDVYFGHGQKAEDEAGIMNQQGRFFALLPKPVVQRLKAAGRLS